ncbi:MAG: hypothetical protein AUJ92_08760 [Armatimonadetes bacterium CG2_30_59_28]|nr:AAA family ATPase [Armatimonadota bacterium]OIO95034.1 MAG: hypothetical protein AUJ92_08760 [Armatimonadetes bacterium CG2_30_59_28]
MRTGVVFSPLDPILSSPVPYGSAWMVRGDSGIGKTVFAFQFCLQALRRGEAVVYVSCDEDPRRTQANLARFGFGVAPYIDSRQLVFVDAFSETPGPQYVISDRTDAEEFAYVIGNAVSAAGEVVRIVVDSVTSLAAYYSSRDLVNLVYEKNRLLRSDTSVLLDLYLGQAVESQSMYCLTNAYDVTVDLYYGEEQGGFPRRSLRVRKVRGGTFDPREFPFRIEPHQGIRVDATFYSK